MGKHKHFKVKVSYNFHLKQKSMQFPKHGKNGFPLYEKSMGKHKHFKFMGLLNFFFSIKTLITM